MVEVGSERGAAKSLRDGNSAATEEICRKPDEGGAAARQQVRSMDTTRNRELLYENFDHPRWDNVASRCLTCANCTMVCPTCFCTTVEDVERRGGRSRRAMAPLGLLFHAELFLHPWRQRPRPPPKPAIASG